MKNRKTNFIKLGILLFGISLFLINCEKEDDTIKNQSNYNTVSINEALSYFNSNEKLRNSSKSYNETYVNPNLNNIYQEKLINSSEALTIVEAKTVFTKHYSRIVMLKINDEIKNVVFSIYPTNSSNKDYFSGEILITDLEGNFLNGFRVKEGIIVSKFIKTTALNKSSNYGNESTDEVCEFHGANNPDCILNMETDEVVVKVKRTAYISVVDLYGGGDFTESDNTCEVGCESWDYGGGGINTNDSPNCLGGKVYNATSKKCECPTGYTGDANGNCVKKPCVGDPVTNPEIAPQTNSGIEGGMHDTCARRNIKYSCKGVRGRKWHNGVDLKNPQGAPIYAVYDGTATIHTQRDDEGNLSGAGYYSAIVSNVNGKIVRMVYFHLQDDNRVTGQVKAGDIIGYQGNSGNLKNGIEQGYTISHVHIKTQENGKNVNPLLHLKTTIDSTSGQTTNPCNN
tara:strand:- start:33557 stop:34921 length:1365 start_codon:yes stop_codon:yes gene_type:complete